ncbi:hypothetical protein L484_007659 [Morus notabilis]|uniref:Uncharacterized protein n=1 Tax=Morus notabilis TaxID=981085 RepID=W9REQ8_9ROSA|nr:vegetative cell wall protein gp1 [Morus notabilis]EXB74653.1 hypothetical protein L484_007659 [Morus notabilis]
MAKRFGEFFFTLLLLIVCVGSAVSAQSPESAPSPAPALGADSPIPVSSAPTVGAPVSDSPTFSPPSPPPETHAPGSSPTSSPPPSPSTEKSPVPSPSPDASDINHSDMDVDGEVPEGSSGGMSGGKKAGIAVGVLAAACLVGLGGFVYKRRQDNIRRSQYGYSARREIL